MNTKTEVRRDAQYVSTGFDSDLLEVRLQRFLGLFPYKKIRRESLFGTKHNLQKSTYQRSDFTYVVSLTVHLVLVVLCTYMAILHTRMFTIAIFTLLYICYCFIHMSLLYVCLISVKFTSYFSRLEHLMTYVASTKIKTKTAKRQGTLLENRRTLDFGKLNSEGFDWQFLALSTLSAIMLSTTVAQFFEMLQMTRVTQMKFLTMCLQEVLHYVQLVGYSLNIWKNYRRLELLYKDMIIVFKNNKCSSLEQIHKFYNFLVNVSYLTYI